MLMTTASVKGDAANTNFQYCWTSDDYKNRPALSRSTVVQMSSRISTEICSNSKQAASLTERDSRLAHYTVVKKLDFY